MTVIRFQVSIITVATRPSAAAKAVECDVNRSIVK